MSAGAQPHRSLSPREASMDKLRDALIQAARENDMPAPQGGAIGGSWQWLWYAPGNSERAYRVDVSAEPGNNGLTVSGHSLRWYRTGERKPNAETWFSRFYPYDEASRELFLEDMQEKLKAAWDSAVTASEAPITL